MLKTKTIALFLSLFLLLSFTACSQKKTEEYNKPAIYWYKKMLEQVKTNNLEKADDFFTSLQSEHINSPLIPEAMLVIAKAHMDKEEYLLAEHYYDEFIKRYGAKDNIAFVKEMKIRSKYFALDLPDRDQQLLIDTIESAEEFIKTYPYSEFRPLVDTMLLNMYLAQVAMDQRIAALYSRLDKPKASEIYMDKYKYDWLKNVVMETPELSWYRELFNW